MSLTVVKGLQSEIFVPITPPMVWTPVEKELKDMTVAIATAAGVHQIDQERFNLAGDFTWRKIDDKCPSDKLMVSHGGYDNSDVNKDINCMFPIDRIHELAAEGFIRACAPVHAGFMGGGGNQEKFKHETGPAIAEMFRETHVPANLLTYFRFCIADEHSLRSFKEPQTSFQVDADATVINIYDHTFHINDLIAIV